MQYNIGESRVVTDNKYLILKWALELRRGTFLPISLYSCISRIITCLSIERIIILYCVAIRKRKVIHTSLVENFMFSFLRNEIKL